MEAAEENRKIRNSCVISLLYFKRQIQIAEGNIVPTDNVSTDILPRGI